MSHPELKRLSATWPGTETRKLSISQSPPQANSLLSAVHTPYKPSLKGLQKVTTDPKGNTNFAAQ